MYLIFGLWLIYIGRKVIFSKIKGGKVRIRLFIDEDGDIDEYEEFESISLLKWNLEDLEPGEEHTKSITLYKDVEGEDIRLIVVPAVEGKTVRS